MSQLAAVPYINFQGHAREALDFYQQIFGGRVLLKAFDPAGPREAGPEDRIMHGVLQADTITIMGSDGLPEFPVKNGDNVAIALSGTDHDQLSLIFDKLSVDGSVKQPLEVETWGDTFGYLVDKYGVDWMVNIYKTEQSS
jgi:PhnB protein